MPRGRPRKPKVSPDFESDLHDKDTAAKDKKAYGTETTSKRKTRGRPRAPRPADLILKQHEDESEQPTIEEQQSNKLPEGSKKKGRQKDEKKSNLHCEFCGKFFKFRATLKQHEQVHFGIKEFECEFCHRRFLHKGTLKVHLRLHTGEMPYKCPHCPKQFRGQTALDCHIFRHTKQGTKCPQCSSVFATPSIVKQHIREVHTTERLNTCQICGVTYKHLKSLRLHLRNHQKRVCPDCGKVFHSVYVMMTHRKIHAQDHFQFKCTFCDRKFEKEDELESHNKLRGRTYQCEMCCHSFNKADYLGNHNRRNHWKELGLEQLKVAPPKNGWNRKGVPKPKKKGTEDEENAPETVDVGNNVGVPTGPEMWPNYNEPPQKLDNYSMNDVLLNVPLSKDANNYSEDVKPSANPNVLIEIMVAPSEGQPARILKTIATEIEPALPYQEIKFTLGEHVQIEPIGQDEPPIEHDHDYGVDDYYEDNDDNDDELVDVGLIEEKPESEIKIKEESDTGIQGFGLSDTTDIQTALVKENPMVEITELPSMNSSIEPDLDSDDDEKPLAVWLPKNKQSPEKQEISNTPVRCTQTEPLSIKSELDDISNEESSRTEPSDDDEKPLKSRKKKPKLFCPYCPVLSDGRSALKRHKKKAHPEKNKNDAPFICEVCGKKYATSTSLLCHRSRHEEYQRYKCDECPKAFSFRCYLETHKRAEHLHERLICPLCGKQFKYSQDLKVHSKQHEEEKPFKCDRCPSAFRYPSALRSHKACHEKTVFSCEICNKIFKYANSLRVHKRLHTGVKRFQCEICEREFNTKAPLIRHMATHSVEREMKCQVCDKIFYKKVDLVIHQSKEHPDNPLIGKTIKIHKCDVCGQEFVKKSNLNAHAYIHGDVYKYKCKVCKDQQFKQHAGLRHHLISFHKMNLSRRDAKSNSSSMKDPKVSSAEGTAPRTTTITVIHNGTMFMPQQLV